MHQETLSRALAELEDAGVITKTNQGYRVADNDEMFGGAGEDFLEGRDGVVNNDELDGGADIDLCISDPDPMVNCERP